MENEQPTFACYQPEYSEWVCYMFCSSPGHGIYWRPLKGKEPNLFWRTMQFLVFGNKWVKEPEHKERH